MAKLTSLMQQPLRHCAVCCTLRHTLRVVLSASNNACDNSFSRLTATCPSLIHRTRIIAKRSALRAGHPELCAPLFSLGTSRTTTFILRSTHCVRPLELTPSCYSLLVPHPPPCSHRTPQTAYSTAVNAPSMTASTNKTCVPAHTHNKIASRFAVRP